MQRTLINFWLDATLLLLFIVLGIAFAAAVLMIQSPI